MDGQSLPGTVMLLQKGQERSRESPVLWEGSAGKASLGKRLEERWELT